MKTPAKRSKNAPTHKSNMYVQEITIELSPDLDVDLMIDEFNWLMSAYHKNGQILSGSQTQFISGNRIISLPYTPERDSLSEAFNNKTVQKQIARIEELCQSSLTFRTIGTDGIGNQETCTCKEHSEFYLSAMVFLRDTPVMCGDCRLMVPLYKLPKTDDDNYSSLLNWQLSSMICDGLETINLKNKSIPSIPNNLLMSFDKLGFEMCEKIELLTGVKTRLLHRLGNDNKKRKSGRAMQK